MKMNTIYLGGPTASGKTEVAIRLAERLNGEIVSCDSMQIYRYLSIGTAKPTAAEQERCRHWLVDFLEPSQEYSVYEYVKDAREAISDILSRGKVPIVVGGTGYYMSSLLHETPYSIHKDTVFSDIVSKEYDVPGGPEKLLREITGADPDHGEKLSVRDRKRIIRAVELLRSTGSTYSYSPDIIKENDNFLFLFSFCDRKKLYERIEKRIDIMVQNGLLDEARYVFDNRESFKTAAAAIGYKEFFPFFQEEASLEECIAELKKATRHYAKRQITWFKRERHIDIQVDSMSTDEIIDHIIQNL